MTEPSPDDQQRAFWDRHADTYDRGMQFAERRILRDTRQWACSRAAGRTLEVAVGTGLSPEAFALMGMTPGYKLGNAGNMLYVFALDGK